MNYQAILEQIQTDIAPLLGQGKVATYIPALASANPKDFAMSLHLVNGESYHTGLVEKRFSIQSISKVFMYECLSETEYAPPFADSSFIPNIFIDITPFFERKIHAMEIYESEVKPAPFPRSNLVIEAHARYRGSRMGVHFAEAFSLLFEAIR
jgi:hypothetical protein